ncbi:MAG: oxidoreductase [Thermoplasmatales archaeon B_DKE]|nr:MAG: oxidoreductase [Thermoplasmatales archaeon B_DKE]
MNAAYILSLLIIATPGIAAAFYYFNIARASVAAGVIVTVMSGIQFFIRPSPGTFYIGNITWVFQIMVTSVYLLSIVYSTRYIRGHASGISEKTYFLLLNLFTVSMLFSVEINNYGLMWVGIEATTISSALLLITERSNASLEAAWRYIIIVSAGVTFAFFSVILIYYAFGSLDIYSIIHGGVTDVLATRIAVSIALIGFGTKVGVFPVHTWLPDAHSEAPSPVSAMFSGVLLPVALYAMYRVYEIDPLPELYVWFGVLSIAAASIFLGYQRRYKRMFAYSTMENMNIALIGLSIGGLGILGALLLLISHGYGKAAAFFSSGNILRATGTKDIADITGLSSTMPMTASSFLLSSLAVTGAPPFGTFFGEFLIMLGLIAVHMYAQLTIILIFLFLAFVSVNFNVTRMIFGKGGDYREADRLMSTVALVASAIPLVIGIVFLVVMNEIL